jgi:hypothetical protein
MRIRDHESDEAGRGPSSGSLAEPEKVIWSPTREVEGEACMSAVGGGLPRLIVMAVSSSSEAPDYRLPEAAQGSSLLWRKCG